MRTVDETSVRNQLRKATLVNGGLRPFARLHGISPAYLSDVLSGRRAPGQKILDVLHLERIVTYRKNGSQP